MSKKVFEDACKLLQDIKDLHIEEPWITEEEEKHRIVFVDLCTQLSSWSNVYQQ